ncbi:MAG: tetratricopeptide repeat protein [Verrucomicrobiota bacterium]|nr:sel1 repeat family protein [Verrucomicrobiota bacterium]MCC6822515.1 sel1 repeat family protein [Limisphaerales bacterium]
MKKPLMLIVVLVIVGIAVVMVWNARDTRVSNPAADAESAAPLVDEATLRARAQAGDSEAVYRLAKSLVKGEYGLPNYSEAASLFQMAVTKGHVESMVGLAELYTIGQGVTNNPAEALRLYLAAAGHGNVRAMYSLAGLYEEGRAVKKDQTLAAKWHQLAAERGEALAQFNLGQRYELGMGVKPDLIEAFKWLRLAANNGIGDASEMIERLERKMTKAQVAEATQRANGFVRITAAPLLTNGLSP